MANFTGLLYLTAGVFFILALRSLSSPGSAHEGARHGVTGMAVAIFATLVHGGLSGFSGWLLAIVGIGIGGGVGANIGRRLEMSRMPQLLALLHSLVGLAVVLVTAGALYAPHALGISAPGAIPGSRLLEMALGAIMGAIAFAGSALAAARIEGRMSAAPLRLPDRPRLNSVLVGLLVFLTIVFIASESHFGFFLLVLVALAIGAVLVASIGLADMPIVASMLSSCSGWAVAAVGFTLGNLALIIAGALVGSASATLSRISSKSMDRSLVSIIRSAAGVDDGDAAEDDAVDARPVKRGSAEDAAYIMQNAASVVIVPGQGMAAAQAQDAVREMADVLRKAGVDVRYAIHPSAGHTAGQINALLAETDAPAEADAPAEVVAYADVDAPAKNVRELADINREFEKADVALVIGANDVTNPAAASDPKSAMHGNPVLDVEKAKTVLCIKRGRGAGHAGVENELFFRDNTIMLFGDAKKVTESIVRSLGR